MLQFYFISSLPPWESKKICLGGFFSIIDNRKKGGKRRISIRKMSCSRIEFLIPLKFFGCWDFIIKTGIKVIGPVYRSCEE